MPIRDGYGKTGALAQMGFRHQAAAVPLRHPLAKGQAQSQTVGDRHHGIAAAVTVKEGLQLLRFHTAAGVRHG